MLHNDFMNSNLISLHNDSMVDHISEPEVEDSTDVTIPLLEKPKKVTTMALGHALCGVAPLIIN